jgi:hypothetical protein
MRCVRSCRKNGGVRRRDVDIGSATLKIERAWLKLPEGRHHLGPPKTSAGRRTLAIPSHVLPAVELHLANIPNEPDARLFPGEGDSPISPRTLDRVWTTARKSVGRPDLRLHDLRHTGLTWSAMTRASAAEIMGRGGHSSPTAALRYQHATDDRNHALADNLARLAVTASITELAEVRDAETAEIRPKLPDRDETQATITPLTSHRTEQSQRGSNPCLHLEREPDGDSPNSTHVD